MRSTRSKASAPSWSRTVSPRMRPSSRMSFRSRLKALLADYKVPRHIDIVARLPREDSGKIFKRRLRDPYWERAGRRI